MSLIDEILDFWFGETRSADTVPEERLRLWFGGNAVTDSLIRSRFAEEVDRALAGAFEEWTRDLPGTLALILLLDQFPRNIYRGTPRAYAGDPRACDLVLAGVGEGRERPLPIVQKAFFYMPLEHAEDPAVQDCSVRAFEQLLEAAPPSLTEVCRGFLDYAERHRRIIERFGRFPHRNRVLGRTSSPEERAFLQQPGSSF